MTPKDCDALPAGARASVPNHVGRDDASVVVTVDAAHDGQRLDRVLAALLPDRSRSLLKRHILAGAVSIDGAPPRHGAKTIVHAGSTISHRAPREAPTTLVPRAIPLEILFEDEHILAVNKQAGLVVHPSPTRMDGTLVHAVLHHLGRPEEAMEDASDLRPGIVHRLDKDTTGVIVVAKHALAHERLALAFKNRLVDKRYVAVTVGTPDPKTGTMDTFFGRHPRARKKFSSRVPTGKRAVTHYSVEEIYAGAALVRVDLETGRTHQIRVHFADRGHPLVGDRTYGRRSTVRDPRTNAILATFGRPALHAARLSFRHPITHVETILVAPMPADLEALLAALREVGYKKIATTRDPR